ncbi:MAG: hypothetical protein PWQ96_669 [Clostridia bacterium]|jgi:PTS system nitrogen regulatory IIA component|nr:sugar transporter subunit [Clostridiales bacterium]MDK2985027.1 hypothetical protein [Clostridia bacterium]
MELKDFIKPEFIKMELASQDKKGVIEELVQVLEDNNVIFDREIVLNGVMEREKKGTTGVGNGVAIPHVKSNAVKKPAIVFGKSRKGIEYESLDGKPAYLFFLIAVPEESDNQHIKLLSTLSRMLVHEDFREALSKADTPAAIREVVRRYKK